MKRLSNAELRTLYQRKRFLIEFIQTTGLQIRANLGDSWRRTLERMKNVREEVKGIVEDPQFDVLVTSPTVSHPDRNTFSPPGTMVNVVASARELLSYIDGVLVLHLNAGSAELRQELTTSGRVFVGHGKNEVVRHRVK